MRNPASLILVVPLLALSIGLLVHHVLAWRRQRGRADLSRDDRRYFRRQFLRRMQASGLMALLSVGLFAGISLVSPHQSPQFFVLFWCGMAVLGIWMGLLALVDLWSVGRYGKRKRRELRRQRIELEEELDRLRSHEGNGHTRVGRRARS